MTRRRVSAIAAVLMVVGAVMPLPVVMAQFELPADVVRATTLSAEQTRQVEQYAQEGTQRLQPGNPQEMKAGRDRILAPLRDRGVSVRFRQEYTAQVLPKLKELAGSEDEAAVINALRIAGELATNDAASLLEERLNAQSVAVRYAAVAGIGRMFDAVAETSPAITRDRVQRLMDRVAERIRQEPSGLVVDAGVRALASAMNISQFEGMRSRAFVTMSEAMGARLKGAASSAFDKDLAIAALRSGETARNALTINDPARALDAAAAKQAGGLSGHLVAYVTRRLQAGDFPHGQPELREGPAQLLVVAETTIPLAASRAGTNVTVPAVSQDFAKATQAADRQYFQSVLQLIGALQRAPFSFPVGQFLGEQAGQGPGGG